MTAILGLNAYHADAAAALLVDGEVVAAAEEERFTRVKHAAGFPYRAARYCLEEAGLDPAQLDHVAINRDPGVQFWRKAAYALERRPGLSAVRDRLSNARRIGVGKLPAELALAFGCQPARIRARVHAVEHHVAHLASSFFVSGFDSATVASVDGFGDFSSTQWGSGRGDRIEVLRRVHFPHSLGIVYLALTQYLGFDVYGDEYKVMGLAGYGEPGMLDGLRRTVRLLKGGGFELDLSYFRHQNGLKMEWAAGPPAVSPVFSERLTDLLGPARAPDEPIGQRHKDIASSLQALYEEAFFHVLGGAHAAAPSNRLCLAGGCAMNSVANGKIYDLTAFDEVFVPAAAGDAGGAVGAAVHTWSAVLGQPRRYRMQHAYLGPGYLPAALRATLDTWQDRLDEAGCRIDLIDDEARLVQETAGAIAAGDVVGWFQGRLEWGPRALGNRSILADPRRADIRDLLNRKVKRRESFRPFAPAVLREAVADWFTRDVDAPFMLQVLPLRADRRELVPAVTHVDGTGRLQSVTQAANPLFHRLIDAFRSITGIPMLLNTSFNESEPIVCTPDEAIDCFYRTRMDRLVLGPFVVTRVRDTEPRPADG